jgi:hypothetical protein
MSVLSDENQPIALRHGDEDLDRFRGVYAFCHDGWLGTLALSVGKDSQLEARYDSIRFRRRFEGRGTIQPNDSKQLEIILFRFNEAPKQIFRGYLSGRRDEFIAGITWWRSVPFGFFARKAPIRSFSRYRSPNDRLTRIDFMGAYTLWHEYGQGTVEIAPRQRGLGAIYTDHIGRVTRMPIQAGGAYDHEFAFSLPLGDISGKAKGYFFTRPKNGAAGIVDWGDHKGGFYMIKYRGTHL